MKTYYVLNKNNIIVETGGDWDRFAHANGGAAAVSEQVLGRCLWDFVKGDEVRSYLNALLFASRSRNRQLSLPLCCDSQFGRRDLCMSVHPMPGQSLNVIHQQMPSTSSLWGEQRPGAENCVNCGGHWTSNSARTVCKACRTRAAEACGVVSQLDQSSEIDFHDAVRIRRAALTQNDSILPLRP